MINREEKKLEAIERMKTLGIFQKTIRQFGEEDIISISEPPLGTFFWAKDEDLERIKKFEETYDALVYLVVRSYTTIGKMDSYLYVGDSEEWELERNDLKNGEPLVYVYNHDAPDCSEIGFIGIERTAAAGLMRTW